MGNLRIELNDEKIICKGSKKQTNCQKIRTEEFYLKTNIGKLKFFENNTMECIV